jgi:hypothetical protein
VPRRGLAWRTCDGDVEKEGRQEEGLEIDRAVVRRLIDFEVLVEDRAEADQPGRTC